MQQAYLGSYINNRNPHHVETENPKLVRNNKIFVVIYLIFEFLFFFMYGFFVRPAEYISSGPQTYGLFLAIGAGCLVLLGFGLVLSYMKHLTWSGIGFTFLITAFTFQFYFLMNGFWTKAQVQSTTQLFSMEDKSISVRLAEDYSVTESSMYNNGASVVQAFKCCLSMVVAFSAILGRGGPLEALIMSIPGVILYELNRQIVFRIGSDVGGSLSIFAFGGWYGVGVSLVLYFLRQKQDLQQHKNYVGDIFGSTMAGIGSLFCWIFFPILSLNVNSSLFIGYLGGINALYCISACVLMTCTLDAIIFGKIKLRDMILSPIAGGIIVGSSSNMITNPVGSILLGMIGAGLLVIFNFVDAKFANFQFVSSNALFLFAIIGLIGGLASAVFRALSFNSPSEFDFSTLPTPYQTHKSTSQIIVSFISLGIGLFAGVIIGLILLIVSRHDYNDNYADSAYWLILNDGISQFETIVAKPEIIRQEGTINGQKSSVKGLNAYL